MKLLYPCREESSNFYHILPKIVVFHMMTSSNENIFRVTGHLCREFTVHRWIPHTKASDAEFDISLICAWINGWVNNREAGDLWRNRTNNNVTVMRQTNLLVDMRKERGNPIPWRQCIWNHISNFNCLISTLRSRHNGRHLTNGIFKFHFLEWKGMNFN